MQLSSLKEEDLTLRETKAAKWKIYKLHGRNYGRSLILEMGAEDVPFVKSKFLWLAVLFFAGLVVTGGVIMKGENESLVKVKPLKMKGKSRKRNK